MKRIFPASFYNLTTLIGAAVAAVSIGVLLFMILLEATSTNSNPRAVCVCLPALGAETRRTARQSEKQ